MTFPLLPEIETPPDVPGYEITRLIGLGGMGAVYLATQQKLNRPVALKFLTRTSTDLEGVNEQRFRREAELMARVSHANIVTIFDFGTVCGRPYLVMEYVQAGDLRSKMVPGSPMAVDRVRAILGPVFRAVEHLHGQGIVHRDIKPENILMPDGDSPKVADFGIAVLDSGFGSLTRTHEALGTPGYVAPEQQYRLKVDERVDQFSLAALSYEMLTGRKPLGAFPPPSKLNPKLSRSGEAAILKALSDDPTDRFASVAEFGEALDRGLLARPGGLISNRRGWAISGGLAAAATILGGIAFFTVPDRGGSTRPADSSVQPKTVITPGKPTPTAVPPSTIVARSANNLELILVPPGEFRMGSPITDPDASPEEQPLHLVRITRGFYLGKTEVTVGQFRTFVEATHYRTTAERNGGGWKYSLTLRTREQRPELSWRNPGTSKPQFDDEPVVQVSWEDAVAFCHWLGQVEGRPFRLPTEAEWEYACRGQTQTRWSFGDTPELLEQFAWTLRNARDVFHPVGTRKPNPLGLHDMHGSVWEWCSDWVGKYSEFTATNPAGPAEGRVRVLRSGSFDWDRVERTRAAVRIGLEPDRCYFNYGFRVCSTATE